MEHKRIALVALTRPGLAVVERLGAALPVHRFCPRQLAGADDAGRAFDRGLAELLSDLWDRYDAVICVMALGIVVRVVGKLARGKAADPAVVVVDEAARFAISVLGGHGRGANQLCRRVADLLGAIPVITTASDVLGLPPPDLIGKDLGWKIENPGRLKAVSADLVNGRLMAVYQDAGESDWWSPFGDWPKNFQRVERLQDIDGTFASAILITDQTWDKLPADDQPVLVYRPPSLSVGVGCRRGVRAEEIDLFFKEVFREHQLSAASVARVATAWLKADEPGLVEFAARLGVPLIAYSAEELESAGPPPTPSEKVRARVGLLGVAEPAAMLAAGTRELVVTKQSNRSITIAVARR